MPTHKVSTLSLSLAKHATYTQDSHIQMPSPNLAKTLITPKTTRALQRRHTLLPSINPITILLPLPRIRSTPRHPILTLQEHMDPHTRRKPSSHRRNPHTQIAVHAGLKLLRCDMRDELAGIGLGVGFLDVFIGRVVFGELEDFDLVLVFCAFEEAVHV